MLFRFWTFSSSVSFHEWYSLSYSCCRETLLDATILFCFFFVAFSRNFLANLP